MFARKGNSIGNMSPSPTRPLLSSYVPPQEIKAIVPAIKQFRRSSSCSIGRTFVSSVNKNGCYTFQHRIVTVTACRHHRRKQTEAGIRV